jgi:hypothetical protein
MALSARYYRDGCYGITSGLSPLDSTERILRFVCGTKLHLNHEVFVEWLDLGVHVVNTWGTRW